MNILKRGKKQDIFNWYLANQEGNKNIKMYEIENLEIILLCSGHKCNFPDFLVSIFQCGMTQPSPSVFTSSQVTTKLHMVAGHENCLVICTEFWIVNVHVRSKICKRIKFLFVCAKFLAVNEHVTHIIQMFLYGSWEQRINCFWWLLVFSDKLVRAKCVRPAEQT